MGCLIYILKPIYKILEFFIKLLLRYQSAIFAIFGVILGCAGLWCAQLGSSVGVEIRHVAKSYTR